MAIFLIKKNFPFILEIEKFMRVTGKFTSLIELVLGILQDVGYGKEGRISCVWIPACMTCAVFWYSKRIHALEIPIGIKTSSFGCV